MEDIMKFTLKEAKLAIYKSQKYIKLYYDHWQTLFLTFKPGDKVYLDFTDMQTICPSTKLSY